VGNETGEQTTITTKTAPITFVPACGIKDIVNVILRLSFTFDAFQREVETLWMSQAAREEMEANLSAISRKIAKANFLLRTMRTRWDLFREKHRDLAPAVLAR